MVTQNLLFTLYRGFTYTFDVSSSTISSGSHVFAFATEADGANNSGYTTGVISSIHKDKQCNDFISSNR